MPVADSSVGAGPFSSSFAWIVDGSIERYLPLIRRVDQIAGALVDQVPCCAESVGDDGTGVGRAGEGLAAPSPDAAGEPAGTDGPAIPDAGALLTADGGPVGGAVGDTSPQATATAISTARTAARRSRGRGSTVTAGGGYRDWPPAVANPAAWLWAGILA